VTPATFKTSMESQTVRSRGVVAINESNCCARKGPHEGVCRVFCVKALELKFVSFLILSSHLAEYDDAFNQLFQ